MGLQFYLQALGTGDSPRSKHRRLARLTGADFRFLFGLTFPTLSLSQLERTMGIVVSLFSQIFPPPSKFNSDDIADLTGKVMIITGANTGEVSKLYSRLISKS